MSRKSTIISDIEKHTSRGHHYLQQGLLGQAKNSYELAFASCSELKNALVERSCAFNLGAVNIALQEADKGLKWLQKAVPPVDERDGTSNGDVYYNLGLAYELLNNPAEAVKYYELASQEYHFHSEEKLMEVTVVRRTAMLFKKLKNPLQAVKFYKMASNLFEELKDGVQQASCLSQMGAQLVLCFQYDAALEAADGALVLCKDFKLDLSLGKLYNELGLVYTQCHSFTRAAHCFKQAVSIFQGRTVMASKGEAVVLQNLGAVYNSLGDYQKALILHESAASMHASNNNRGLQGQCFTNLAFAYSQLNDLDTAGECYMHAVQAAKDAKDKKGQWQAMEGLGSVCFQQGKINKAVVYFKLALRILVDTRDYGAKTEERLLGKITDALQHHVMGPHVPGLQTQHSIQYETVQEAGHPMPNDAHTVSEGNHQHLKMDASLSLQEPANQERSVRKVARKFDDIAHGIGRYSTDDDLSVASSIREHPKVVSSDRPDISKTGDSVDNGNFKRRQKGLLRTQTHNSEQEWQKEVKDIVSKEHLFGAQCIPGHSGQDSLKFVEKLHPISSNDESVESSDASEKPKKRYHQEKIKQILKREVTAEVHQWDGGVTRERPGPVERTSLTEGHSPSPVQDHQSSIVTGESNHSSSSELGTDENLLQYQHRIRRKSMHEELSSHISSDDESSEADTHSDYDTQHNRPPVPLESPEQTLRLTNTYEEPLPVRLVSPTSEESGPYGANYFRPDHQEEELDGRKSGTEGGSGMNETDPLYQTIQSVHREGKEETGVKTDSEKSQEIVTPELPPRRQHLSRAEEEVYLRNYHSNLQQATKLPTKQDLPSKDKRKSKSQMCHIM